MKSIRPTFNEFTEMLSYSQKYYGFFRNGYNIYILLLRNEIKATLLLVAIGILYSEFP